MLREAQENNEGVILSGAQGKTRIVILSGAKNLLINSM